MFLADNSIHHLLWCILVALRTAEQEKSFPSEMARRRFLSKWLDKARLKPGFKSMNTEFSSLRELLETSEKSVPIDETLSTLFHHASAAEHCDLFRFRSALNTLMHKGWRLVVCRFPENITTELMHRRRDRRKHALQLTRTENAFQTTGNMIQPVTFQLLLNSTEEISDDLEAIFHSEGFQVVVADIELTLDNRRLVRTVHTGKASLAPGEWSPREGEIWKPKKKESYH